MTSGTSISRRGPVQNIAAVLMVGAILAATVFWWNWSAAPTAEELLAQARQHQSQRHYAKAEQLARRSWQVQPTTAAAFLAAECAAAQQAWSRVLEHLEPVNSPDRTVQLPRRLTQAGVLHHKLFRLRDAERAYRAALELDPGNIVANTGLAELLSLCARTREAAPHILQLIRQGADTELLVLLVRSDAATNTGEGLQQARLADPSDPNPLVALAWHDVQRQQSRSAELLLNEAITLDPANIPAILLKGRILLSLGRSDEFSRWLDGLPPDASSHAEVWLLRGQMAEALHDSPGALRCFWEAARRAPESKLATFRLAHHLSAAGEKESAEAMSRRLQQLTALETMQNSVLMTANQGRPEMLLPLAKAFESAGRVWEALGWVQFAMQVGVANRETSTYAEKLRERLAGEPLVLVTKSANVAATLDLSNYPVPNLRAASPSAPSRKAVARTAPTFLDDASSAGLKFQYFNGVEPPTTHRMFEFTGGGVGVIDFDVDGWPDVFCTQGRRWPLDTPDERTDRLFRNRIGVRFEDRSQSSGLYENGFGQGTAVGDVNADGFPDLYVANIGQNCLWLNNGDGTFTDVTESAGVHGTEWTTSAALIDLTGDGSPDIYDVNYVTASDVFDRVCQYADGSPLLCMPHDFQDLPDRIWVNAGDGTFRDGTREVLGEVPQGKGLGIAAWDADGSGRLSVYVANDTTPSFFFRPVNGGLRESGVEAGLAFNGSGKATGCMGAALGDIDGDGRLDLHVTNFYAEPSTLFLNSAPGLFTDETRRAGLEGPSLQRLGFGTQFLDADLDGRLELFVANGHVDDLMRLERPYRMPAQLFAWDGNMFSELRAAQLGPYFERDWLGRAAARFDWNRDGREDLLVGHLYDNVALLTNTTASVGRALTLRLIGVASRREAIGAIATVRLGERTMTRQLTAGDGYQCSNERALTFGLGDAGDVDELTVRWPSGREQRFTNVAAPAELLLREGGELLPLIHQ